MGLCVLLQCWLFSPMQMKIQLNRVIYHRCFFSLLLHHNHTQWEYVCVCVCCFFWFIVSRLAGATDSTYTFVSRMRSLMRASSNSLCYDFASIDNSKNNENYARHFFRFIKREMPNWYCVHAENSAGFDAHENEIFHQTTRFSSSARSMQSSIYIIKISNDLTLA